MNIIEESKERRGDETKEHRDVRRGIEWTEKRGEKVTVLSRADE